MLKSQIQNITVSGYIYFNKDFNVQETGGNTQALFFLSPDKKNTSFHHCISGIDKNGQELLIDCLSRVQSSRQVINCKLDHAGEIFHLTFTPLERNELMLSFVRQVETHSEVKDHLYWHSLHSKTITLSFNPKLQHVFVSGPVDNLLNADADLIIGCTPEELDYPDELRVELEKIASPNF